MPDKKWKVAKEREFTNKEADGTSDYVSSISELSTAVYRRSNKLKQHRSHPAATTWLPLPSSHISLYICKAHRHRGERVSALFTVCPCLLPVITNTQPSRTLKNWHAQYFALSTVLQLISGCQREIYSQQRCQHPAASLAEYNGRPIHVLFHM